MKFIGVFLRQSGLVGVILGFRRVTVCPLVQRFGVARRRDL